MSNRRDEIDDELLRVRLLESGLTEQNALDGIKALIVDYLENEKVA